MIESGSIAWWTPRDGFPVKVKVTSVHVVYPRMARHLAEDGEFDSAPLYHDSTVATDVPDYAQITVTQHKHPYLHWGHKTVVPMEALQPRKVRS